MNVIEKFIIDQYSPMITEDSNGIKCLFKHKEGLTDDGVIYFEFAKKGWSKKPVMNKRQFVIVDAHMSDVLQFLNQYSRLMTTLKELQLIMLVMRLVFQNMM